MKKTMLLLAALLSLNACSIFYNQDPRSVGTAWQDNQLTLRIAGIKSKESTNEDFRLNTVSFDGNVILIGQARTAELKSQLIEKVRVLAGVKKVYDQIHVKEPISFSQRSRDSWTTAKIKSKLVRTQQLMDANIKVITEDSEVFLFGYVNPEQGIQATEIARNIGGVKRVIQAWF